MNDQPDITTARDGPMLTITIDRPAVLNALDPPAHAALHAAFDAFAADPDLRVAILTGAGARAFCVGTDLKAKAVTGRDDHPVTGFGGITRRFDLEKPVIAAVNGAAIGGGVELILACDIAVAADTAVFSLPEPHVGLAASGGGGIQRLVRQIPFKHALDLLLTGRRIDAAEACAMGLVGTVVPPARLMATAMERARQILQGAPLAIAAAKQVAARSLEAEGLEAALRQTYPALETMLRSEDAREGPKAFAEKRKPDWKGR